MTKMKKRKIFKTIGLVVLGLGILGGVIAITNHFIRKDEVDVHPTYEIGGLDANGKYEEDKGSLYTKTSFACEGLKATLDFDSQINYQIFYYDILDNYLSSTEVLSEGYTGEIPFECAYARIEITPTNDSDGKISWVEKHKYSNQLNLKVSKNAKNVEDKFMVVKGHVFRVVENVTDSVFKYGYGWNGEEVQEVANTSITISSILKVDNRKTLTFDIGDSELEMWVNVYQYFDKPSTSLKYTSPQLNPENNYTLTLDKKAQYVILEVRCKTAGLESLNGNLHSMFKFS